MTTRRTNRILGVDVEPHAQQDGRGERKPAVVITAARVASDPAPGADAPCAALARRLVDSEQRAQQAERMAAIGRMAAELAHEGRNCLQQIATNLAMLALRVPDRPEVLGHVARADRARQRLTRLFDDLLGCASAPVLDREDLDLGEVWRRAWADLGASGQGRRAELVEVRGPGLSLRGDRFRLEQVFRNLFENALAACADPVRVEIRSSEATHRGRPALRLCVADNGPGLTPEQRRRAFEPFYTTRPSGTGLGLPIVRRIVEAHGGEIGLGDGGGGAEFIIMLPRR